MPWDREKNNRGCPCKGCERREVGCHGRCLFYSEWKAVLDEISAKKRLAKEAADTIGRRRLMLKTYKRQRYNRRKNSMSAED